MKKEEKKEEQQVPDESKFFESIQTTVECPVHKLPLQIQTENVEIEGKTVIRRFAICGCLVEGNQYLGKRVWEQT